MAQQLKIRCGLVCDDARIEQNNKMILIGVYGGAILVKKYPAPLRLSCWFHGEAPKTGEHEFEVRLRVIDDDGKKTGEAKGPVKVTAEDDLDLGIAVNGIPVTINGPGKLKVDYRPKGVKNWRVVIEKRIGAST